MKLLCFLIILPCYAWGQVQEELTVTVREMRVHVVDKDGLPVKHLTPEDFILSHKGEPNPLSFFEEVDLNNRNEVRPAHDEPGNDGLDFVISDNESNRNVVLFVDSSHLTRKSFETLKQTLRDFILTSLNPRDRVKIVHWDEQVNHLTGFSQDRETALSAMEEMKFVGRMRRDMIKAQRTIDSEISDWDDALRENPEVAYSYVNSINQLIRQKARLKAGHYRTYYLNMLSVGYMLEQMSGPKSIFLFTGGSYLEVSSTFGDTTDLSERLGRVLNRANATIYTVMVKVPQPVGGQPPNLQSVPPNFASQFKYTSVFPPGGANDLDVAVNTIAEDNQSIESGPAASAEATGGVFLKAYNDTKLAKQLQQVQKVSSSYYRLAFSIDDPQERTKVTVKLKDKQRGWKLLYGREIEKTVPYLELDEEERNIAMTSMLLYGSKFRDDFTADWDARVFTQATSGFRVAMMGRFERPRKITNGIEMGFVALDESRNLLDMATGIVSKTSAQKTFSFYDVLLTEKHPKFLRFYARSLDSGEYTFHEMEIEGGLGDSTTRLSEIMMDQPGGEKILALNQLNFVKQGSKKASERVVQRSELDPFRMEDKVYAPDVAPYNFSRGIQGFMFHLENPVDPDKTTYEVQYLVKSAAGYQKVPGRVVASWTDELGNIRYQGQIKTDDLDKGPYALYVRVKCTDTDENYTQGVSFRLN